MPKDKRRQYCYICRKECEYKILQDEDEAVLRENSHAVLRGNSHAVLTENSHAVLWENSHAELTENSHAVLRGNSHAVLRGNSHAVLWGNSHAVFWENSHAVLWENSHAELTENSHAVLWENSHAELTENSHAVLWENSHAELTENSHAVLRGNSHAELRGNSHAVLWENSHAEGRSPYATSIVKSTRAKANGGNIHGTQTIPATQWLQKCGVEIKKGYAVLFKSVNADFTTRNGVSLKPRTHHEAPDWDSNFKEECGRGIHYSPTVAQARVFRDEGVFVACRVKISDMADLPPYAEYPDKIRARGGYTLYEVDEHGKRKTKRSK